MLIDSYSRPSVCISVMCVVLKQSIFFIDFVPCSHQSVSSGILRHLPSSQKIFQFQCLWNSAVAIGAMHRSSNGRMNQKGFQHQAQINRRDHQNSLACMSSFVSGPASIKGFWPQVIEAFALAGLEGDWHIPDVITPPQSFDYQKYPPCQDTCEFIM